MAVGLQTDTPDLYNLFRLVEGAITDVAAPSVSTDGVEVPNTISGGLRLRQTEMAILLVYDTSGSGVIAITYGKLWGYVKAINKWFPLGSGADADRGKINEGLALGEVAADDLRLAEVVQLPMVFDRLAIQLNTVAGTNPVINVDLLIPKHVGKQSHI